MDSSSGSRQGWTELSVDETAQSLPDRQFFMVVFTVGATFGGMTAMCLKRAELFSREGRTSTVLTFDAFADYPLRVKELRANAQLAPKVHFKNIFQELSETELGAAIEGDGQHVDATPGVLASHDGGPQVENRHDGSIFRERYALAADAETDALRIYYRPDGTIFLIDRITDESGSRTIEVVRPDGSVHRAFQGPGAFYRWWIDLLVADGPSAVMVDSAFAARFIAPWNQGEHLKIALVHVNHVKEGSNPMTGVVGAVRNATFKSAPDWDAVVFLTERQKSDFTRRFGERSNVYRVPNPRQRVPELPAFKHRNRVRGVSVTRLEKVKNVDQTIAIMKVVREQVPEAYVDVYGTGSQEKALRLLAEQAGMSEGVRFRGHITNAADEFSSAGYCVFPSHYEGLPLAMMESLGRGCPVVSYDIDYGPSDLLEDGTNGFLVPRDDVHAAAERIVRLIRDAELQERMSKRAWERAEMFGEKAVVAQWARVLNEATERRAYNIRVQKSSLEVESIAFDKQMNFTVKGRLTLKVTGNSAVAPAIRVVLRSRASGEIVAESAVATEDAGGGSFDVNGTVRLPADTLDILDGSIEWTWENAANVHRVSVPGGSGRHFPYATAHGNVSFKGG